MQATVHRRTRFPTLVACLLISTSGFLGACGGSPSISEVCASVQKDLDNGSETNWDMLADFGDDSALYDECPEAAQQVLGPRQDGYSDTDCGGLAGFMTRDDITSIEKADAINEYQANC